MKIVKLYLLLSVLCTSLASLAMNPVGNDVVDFKTFDFWYTSLKLFAHWKYGDQVDMNGEGHFINEHYNTDFAGALKEFNTSLSTASIWLRRVVNHSAQCRNLDQGSKNKFDKTFWRLVSESTMVQEANFGPDGSLRKSSGIAVVAEQYDDYYSEKKDALKETSRVLSEMREAYEKTIDQILDNTALKQIAERKQGVDFYQEIMLTIFTLKTIPVGDKVAFDGRLFRSRGFFESFDEASETKKFIAFCQKISGYLIDILYRYDDASKSGDLANEVLAEFRLAQSWLQSLLTLRPTLFQYYPYDEKNPSLQIELNTEINKIFFIIKKVEQHLIKNRHLRFQYPSLKKDAWKKIMDAFDSLPRIEPSLLTEARSTITQGWTSLRATVAGDRFSLLPGDGEKFFVFGALPTNKDIKSLSEGFKINAVLSLVEKFENEAHDDGEDAPISPQKWKDLNVMQLQLPLAKSYALDIETMLLAIDFIQFCQDQQLNILVHCGSGCGRSAVIVMGYLVKHKKRGANRAYEQIIKIRPQAELAIGCPKLQCLDELFYRENPNHPRE